MVSGLNGSGLVYCTKPCWLKAQLVCYVSWKDQTLRVGCKEYMVSGLVRAYVSVVSGEWYHGGGLVSGEWCYSLPGHRIIRGRWFHNPHNPNLSSTTICPRCNLWKLLTQLLEREIVIKIELLMLYLIMYDLFNDPFFWKRSHGTKVIWRVRQILIGFWAGPILMHDLGKEDAIYLLFWLSTFEIAFRE